MANRIFYASQQVGIAQDASTTFTAIHGVQSVSSSTNFNLVQVFELGQISIYDNIEQIPEVNFSISKVLDGYPLIYHLATRDALTPTLSGRSTSKCLIAVGIFSDSANSCTGTPISQVQASGMFVSSLSYSFTTEDNFTESVSFVGNNKVWANDANNINTLPWTNAGSLTFTGAFASLDSPEGSGGVNRRQNLLLATSFTSSDNNGMIDDHDCTILPPDVFGISASGVNRKSNGQDFDAHLQSISVNVDLNREELNELGRRGPYARIPNFPVEVTCEIQVTSTSGDMVSATEAGIRGNAADSTCSSVANLQNRTIRIATCEGTRIYLGLLNKLSAVSYSGGDAGGGSVTVSYSYANFNDCSVLHSGDPNVNFLWANRATYLVD